MLRTPLIILAAFAALLAATGLSRAQSDNCARMQSRLDRLNNDPTLDEYEFNLRRDRIEAALDANNCPINDYQYRDLPRLDEEEPGSYEIYGGREPQSVGPGSIPVPIEGGQYQTMCVRTCDGYYFPLTYETGAENFPRDQAQCQAQCPGAQLFFKPTGEERPEAMISLGGQAYRDMPNAFKFRKAGANGTPQCTCQKTAGNFSTMGNPRELAKQPPKPVSPPAPAQPATPKTPSIIAVDPQQPAVTKQEPLPTAPAPTEPAKPPVVEPAKPAVTEPAKPKEQPVQTKAEPALPAPKAEEKPSSIIELGKPAAAEAPLPKPLSEDKPIDPNRKVRVVGPTFLPDQGGATDPQAQDRKPGP
ncbi:DUF2865 domain-containing protein [Phyllobacterium sp. YR531]|uniref:DUF2865 domain-containing protein n=1 Tax=Phyllobacterium sp. YR531 TaxID=1144343 RepID=UPI00026F63C7|nr:DUF2865 domain-containing protein [Phyllobacterium sp. YR531]EJN03859.1 Protein of unknown function (DUF2865) [Phyllobacterium sp. YR531]